MAKTDLLRYIWDRWLFETSGPAWKYILRAVALSLVPSLAIATLLGVIGVANEGTLPDFEQERMPPPLALFVSVVVISPIIETLAMAVILGVLSRCVRRRLRLVATSAVIWGVFHSLLAAAWGLIIVWPFVVFSCAYLAWRERSVWRALWVVTCIHGLHNLLPGLVITIGAAG